MASRDLAEIDHVMMNLYWQPLTFQVPSVPGRQWGRVIETLRPSPQDLLEPGRERPITGHRSHVKGRSLVVLMPQAPSTPIDARGASQFG
jgi:pullulanase/glycogen debranching enzyme